MSYRRALARRSGAVLATLTALTSVVLVEPATAAAPAYTLEERAQAIAEPAVVYTELIAEGVIRDKRTGQPITGNNVVVSIRCSAVVVNPSGAALTTRFCVAPTRARVTDWAFNVSADQQILAGKLTEAGRQAYVAQLTATADFTAATTVGDPPRRLFAQLGDVVAGTTSAPAMRLDTAEPTSDGDVGLTTLKLPQSGLPAIELAGATGLMSGAQAVAIGYGAGSTFGNSPGSGLRYTLGASPVKITGVEGNHEPPSYKVDTKLAPEVRGGPLIDLNGLMIGAFLWSDTVNDSHAVATALADTGVRNELSPTDVAYRQALDDYFAGHYDAAIKKLDLVIAAAPTNAMASRYRALATSRRAIEGGEQPTSMSTWLIVALSAIGGAVLCGLIAVLLWRRRSRAVTAPTETLIPISVNPFAPTSGPGAMSYSDSGFHQYPTAGYPVVDPSSPAPARPTPILEIPEAAPPGVPVPHPPTPAQPQPQPPQPQPPVSAPPAVGPESMHPGPADPEATPATPAAPANGFVWPEDDESGPRSAPNNPWAPPAHS